MARKKLFGNRRQASCDVCEFGRLAADGEVVLCSRKGVVPTYHHCRRFRYDPLKRIPARSQPLGRFSSSDFSLEELPLDEYVSLRDAAAAHSSDTQNADTKKEALGTNMADDTFSANQQPQDETVLSSETVTRLKMYLSNSASPTTRDILTLLNNQSNTADNAAPSDPRSSEEQDDAFQDLQNLSFESVRSSIRASLLNSDLRLADDMTDEELMSFSEETLDISDLQFSDKPALHASLDNIDSIRFMEEPTDTAGDASSDLEAENLILLSYDALSDSKEQPIADDLDLINMIDLPDEPEDEAMITLDDLPQAPEKPEGDQTD
ncbi:MAG: hypothetical protein ACI39E_02780 [Acutalibacteraceae bacterium]